MPPRKCCCNRTCSLGLDDFNRTELGSNWSTESGEWEIDGGVLVCITPGVLATTICHPSWAPLGSFRSNFKLMNPVDGKVYKVRAGNPATGAVEATWTISTAGGGNLKATLVVDAGGDSKTAGSDFEFSPGSDEIVGSFCYVPGVQATAGTALLGGAVDNLYSAEICIDDTGAAACHSGLGNFSFLEGDFDDWLYEIHWKDNRNCNYCECLCVKGLGLAATVRCWPDVMYLTLTNSADCPGVPTTFTLQALEESGGTNFDIPITNTTGAKRVWVSETITRDDFYYHWRLDCDYVYGDNYTVGYPKMRLQLVFWTDLLVPFPMTADPTGAGDYLGFDLTYDETIDIIGDGPNNSRTNALALSTSACDPILLRFPPIIERRLVFGTMAFLCSNTGYHTNTLGDDGEEYAYEFSVEVTE